MNNTLKSIMNKKGQTEVVISAIILAGMLIGGIFASNNILSENRYVGDKTTFLVYDLSKCDIKDIPQENLINFKNLEGAKNEGYTEKICK